jgi:lipopolysaccharide export system protein LptC
MRREIAYIAALAVLAGLSALFLSSIESSLNENSYDNDDVPQLYMDNFEINYIDQEGLLKYIFIAPYLVQLPGQEGTRVRHPKMDIFENGRTRIWLLQAEKGWISPDNDIIRLETVKATRPPSSGEYPMVLTTSHLTLYPDEDFAETAEPVRMESPQVTITGTGLEAYLDEQRLNLLSDVQSHYVSTIP